MHDSGDNLSVDPLFNNELTDAHLKLGSPAIGAAAPTADLTGPAAKDIDGEARVKRDTNKGADS